MGLPNISSNADKFNITSKTGVGTIVEITIHLNPIAA